MAPHSIDTCLLLLAGSLLARTIISAPASHESRASRFTFYDMLTPLSLPCDVGEGPDGMEWSEELAGNNLVRIDSESGNVTEYPIPFTTPVLNLTLPKLPGTGTIALSCGLETAPDGNLYATNGLRNQVVVMSFPSMEINVYSAPAILGNLQPLNDITPAPHALYFSQTTANMIGRFDYKTHKFQNFEVPTPAALPVGVYYASDHGVWFMETAANKIGRLDTHTHNITEYALPPALFGPLVMRAETEGRYLWFAAIVGGSIGRVDMQTGAIKPFPIPHLPELVSAPVEVCASDDGDIWFTELTGSYLGRLTPSSGEVKQIPLPGPIDVKPQPFIGSGIFCKPGRNVWFSEASANRVGKYSLAS